MVTRIPRVRIPGRLGLFVVGLMTALGIALTGCGQFATGGGYQTVSYAQPVNPGYAHINGVTFCVYTAVQQECQLSGLPPTQWISLYQLENAGYYNGAYSSYLPGLLSWYLYNHLWFDSMGYYNTYILHNHYIPASRVAYARSAYHTRTATTDRVYHSRERATEKSYFAHTKFRTSSGKVVSGRYAVSHGLQMRNSGGQRSSSVKLCRAQTTNRGRVLHATLTAFTSHGPSGGYHSSTSHSSSGSRPSGSRPGSSNYGGGRSSGHRAAPCG